MENQDCHLRSRWMSVVESQVYSRMRSFTRADDGLQRQNGPLGPLDLWEWDLAIEIGDDIVDRFTARANRPRGAMLA